MPVVAIAIVPAAYLFLSTIIRLFLSEQSLSIIEVLADGIVLTLYGLILGTFALPITQWLDRLFTPREISMGRLR